MIDIIVAYYWIIVLVRDSTSIADIKSIFNSENVLVSVIFFSSKHCRFSLPTRLGVHAQPNDRKDKSLCFINIIIKYDNT